jgi:hypothetical protein
MDRTSVHPGTITGQVSAHGAMVADGAGNVFETHPVNTWRPYDMGAFILQYQ